MPNDDRRVQLKRAVQTAHASRAIRTGVLLLLVIIAGTALLLAGGSEPHQAGTAATSQDDGVRLTREQQDNANVTVAPIRRMPLRPTFRAPGEVQTNGYTAGIIAVRVTATVVSRAAQLGDTVTKGQALITLYSQDVAAAQSAYLLAQRNLARLTRIKAVIAEQQLDEARAKRQEARGRLESYGLTSMEIAALSAKGLGNDHAGQFVLSAPVDGTIIEDNFKVGDVVEAGKPLFQVADLTDVWVEAHVSPTVAPKLAGPDARVIVGDETYPAQIVQIHDTVDETTRTVGIRLKLENGVRALRPGQFVDVELYGPAERVLSVPMAAVLRNAAGHWVVYARTKAGAFVERSVKVLFTANDRTAVDGVAPGTPVVTRGAFFVMSEAAKASFGEDE